MTSIKLLRVSAQECQPQGVLQINGTQDQRVNPLNAELNPICLFLALVGAHHILSFASIGRSSQYSPRYQDKG